MFHHPTKSHWLVESKDIEILDTDRRANTQTPLRLPTNDPVLSEKSIKILREVLYWARGFLAHPHQHLGRTGNVCPFAKGSLTKNLFWMNIQQGIPTSDSLGVLMGDMLNWFIELEPNHQDDDSVYKTILTIFPDIIEDDSEKILDSLQQNLKTRFVEKGFMIGQFYKGCKEKGIRNPEFLPLQSPAPLLAIRKMVPTDIVFLSSNQEHWNAYKKLFSIDDLPETFKEIFDQTESIFHSK